MQTEMPFYDSPEDALRAAVQSLGGAKVVSKLLWPTKDTLTASKKLLDAINPDRDEKLSISEIMFIFRAAKEKGVNAPYEWFSSEIGYDVRPISKIEAADRIAIMMDQSSKTFAKAVADYERLQRSGLS